jgi:hypothetical protein
MKKTLTLLSIITLISFYAKAQDSEPKEYVKSYLTLFGGISTPLSDYKNSTYENYKSGFAKRGASAGFEGAYYFYKNLGFVASFSFQDNGELTIPDVQVLANGYNKIFKVNSTLVQGVGRFHNLQLMGGPQYSFTYHKFILDVQANAGVIKSTSTPVITIFVSNTDNTSQSISQNSSKGTAFAYGGKVGLRWEFADGWDIGLRFNYITTDGTKINTTGDVSALHGTGRLVTTQPISSIQSTFGIGVHF